MEKQAEAHRAVLIVDDEQDMREVLRWLFEDAEYSVYEASNGVSALTLLRTSAEPLIVVLDWQMPEMDGLQVLEALSADAPVANQHSFLLLTAWYHDLGMRLEQLHPALHLTTMRKPFDLDALLTQVAALDVEQHTRHTRRAQ